MPTGTGTLWRYWTCSGYLPKGIEGFDPATVDGASSGGVEPAREGIVPVRVERTNEAMATELDERCRRQTTVPGNGKGNYNGNGTCGRSQARCRRAG